MSSKIFELTADRVWFYKGLLVALTLAVDWEIWIYCTSGLERVDDGWGIWNLVGGLSGRPLDLKPGGRRIDADKICSDLGWSPGTFLRVGLGSRTRGLSEVIVSSGGTCRDHQGTSGQVLVAPGGSGVSGREIWSSSGHSSRTRVFLSISRST